MKVIKIKRNHFIWYIVKKELAMKRKDAKEIILLSILIILVSLIIFSPYLINHMPLTYGTDIKPQWFEFYTEFKNLINQFFETKQLPFYSWNLFLGNNFYASKSYYLMGDIFSYIGLLFPLQFFDVAQILEILKFLVSGLTMYYLLSCFEFKSKVKMIGAIAYTFSSWAIFFSGQLSFLSFYSWMPLYFAAIELYLKKGKKLLFPLTSMLLLFTNFYFFFTLSCITPFYYLYRYSLVKPNYKNVVKDTLILAGCYLIGVCMTGILTIPTASYILQNDRVGQFSLQLFFNQISIYLHELCARLVPNYIYIYRTNIFETASHTTRELCLYSGVLSALLLPQVFSDKDKRYRKNTLIFYLFLNLFLVFPVFSSVIHGFSSNSFRCTLILIIVQIIIMSHYLEKIDSLDIKNLKITTVFSVFILLTIIPMTAYIINKPVIDYVNQIILFIMAAFFVVLNSWVILKKKSYLLLLFLLCIEYSLSGLTLYYSRMKSEGISYEFVDSVTHVLQDEDNELNEFLENIEPINPMQYYRTYIPLEPIYWDFSHNMSLMVQLQGTMTYDSTYAPSFNKMKKIAPQVKDYESDWIFNIKDPEILKFLSVKYAIVTDSEQLPSGMNWRLLTDNYRSGLLVYRNDDYRSLGVTYNQIKKMNELEDGNSMSILMSHVLCNEEDYSEIQQVMKSSNLNELENVKYAGNHLTGSCYTDDSSFLVLSLPYDAGWNVLVNGTQVKTYDVNGGFIGFGVSQGENQIEMYFTPVGFKQGAILSILGFSAYILLISCELLRAKKIRRSVYD